MTSPPRFEMTIGGFPLTDLPHGLRQRDVLDAEIGMSAEPSFVTGGGQHGGSAGRTIYGPGVMVIPVDVFATYGTTVEQREESYQSALRWLKRIVQGGELRCEAAFGSGVIARANVVCLPLVNQGEIIEGNTFGVPIMNMTAWRETIDREISFVSPADPETLDLTEFAGSTSPLVSLVVEIDGPSDPITIAPLDTRLGAHAPWSMIYDVTIPGGETVTIETETGVITATDDALVDYSALTHPGNPGYILEVPPGPVGGAPQVNVIGGPAEIRFIGRRVWTEL